MGVWPAIVDTEVKIVRRTTDYETSPYIPYGFRGISRYLNRIES